MEDGKQQQIKPKVIRKKEIMKNRTEINEIESKKMIQKINESKSWFFEKIKRLTICYQNHQEKRERTQINKIINERGEITTDTKEIQRIVIKYYKLYATELDDPDEMDKFLETYNLPKLNQEESENVNGQIAPSEIEAVIKKNSQQTKALG